MELVWAPHSHRAPEDWRGGRGGGMGRAQPAVLALEAEGGA